LTRSTSLQLRTGEVDVWLTSLSDIGPAQELACQQLLSEPERTKWQRFLVPHARLQYLVTRALVRTALSKYADVPRGEWRFETNGYGRPHLARAHDLRDLRFNLSNTAGLVACAISRNDEIGIDVETMARHVDVDAVAPTVFAPAELADFRRATADDRIDRFFSYWTLKEAYIKARGIGLSLPLDGFWFELGGSSPILHVTDRCPDIPGRWRFYQYAPTDAHKMAIAVAASAGVEPSIRLSWMTPV